MSAFARGLLIGAVAVTWLVLLATIIALNVRRQTSHGNHHIGRHVRQQVWP
jgi:ABC-type spermidine/putrescine transport system permease subunit II